VGVDVGEVSVQGRRASTDPGRMSRKSCRVWDPPESSIATSLPIQFHGGPSRRIPSRSGVGLESERCSAGSIVNDNRS